MAEQPVMDSATETPSESVAPKPTSRNVNETAEHLNTLLNASQAQDSASEESTKEVADSETNIDETFEDDELLDHIEDEQTSESNQELYKVVVDGQEQEVTLDELTKGYSRQSDYTRKTEKLSQERKTLEEKNAEALRRSEEAKIKRDEYAQNLRMLSEQLNAEPQVDMDQLYREDPAEYVRVKADQDKRKELLQASIQEQQRLQAEKQVENDKKYQTYLAEQRELLTQKLPIYADKNKGPEFVKNLTNYAKDIGYTDQDIAQLVDHRAVIMLANAYRYDKLKKANLKNKKVTKVSKVISSSSAKVQDDNEIAKRMKSKQATLKKTGKVNDAVSVLQEMFSQ